MNPRVLIVQARRTNVGYRTYAAVLSTYCRSMRGPVIFSRPASVAGSSISRDR
jgi:hypothetical protein